MVFKTKFSNIRFGKLVLIIVIALVIVSLWIKAIEAFLSQFAPLKSSSYGWAVFGVCGFIISIILLQSFTNLIPENIFGGLFSFRFRF